MELNLNTFKKLFYEIAIHQSASQVFRDFLDIVICALSGEKMEAEYLQIISKYKKKDTELFSSLFSEMVWQMDAGGTGYGDVLGEFFMQEITHGKNGQFFTPQPVTDMMALITGEACHNKTVCDPACGSGRTLMSFAKAHGKMNWFFAADLDDICAKMTSINFCLNGLRGQVAHMNSLSLDLYKVYEVFYDPGRQFAPTIRIIEKETSVFFTNKEAFSKAVVQSRKEAKQSVIKQHEPQLDLFAIQEV